MIDIEDYKKSYDISFRMSEYNKMNGLDNSSWISLKKCIVVEAYNRHPEPLPQKAIKDLYSFHVSTISRCIKILKNDGLITVSRLNTTDASKAIRLTDNGLAMIKYVWGVTK